MESQEPRRDIGSELVSNEPSQGKAEKKATEMKYPHKGTLCLHSKTCYKEVGESFFYNFLRGFAIKLLLRLITERSFRSIRKSYKDIPKFGLVVGLFSGLFKLTRCLLNRYF